MVREGETARVVPFLFLRFLSLIYCLAFISCAVQMQGLYGSDGIIPVAELLGGGRSAHAPVDAGIVLSHPSIFWLASDDTALNLVPWLGALLSFLALLGILEGPMLLGSWFLYLSIITVGQTFMSFQWDALLLETGFLAIFLASWRPLAFFWSLLPNGESKLIDRGQPSFVVIYLFRFLLFKLMLMSGLVKILSNDPTWSSLTALQYHYFTQPLPTPLAYFADKLPGWFQIASCAGVFFIELLVPFGMLFPYLRLRLITFILTVALQVLILLTGNYCFFNLLTIALCFMLLDDSFFLERMKVSLRDKITRGADEFKPSRLRPVYLAPLLALLVFLNAVEFDQALLGGGVMPPFMVALSSPLVAYRIVNNYGLFARMTTTRPEIILEGSLDGSNWEPYLFRYKAGPLERALPVVAPFQPRLDWQMWFAALSPVQYNPWFVRFSRALLTGSRSVSDLLQSNPFPDPDKPPVYLRAKLYEYRFSSMSELIEKGRWWTRTYKEDYIPQFSLADISDRRD